jgi:hypothetical protein
MTFSTQAARDSGGNNAYPGFYSGPDPAYNENSPNAGGPIHD